MEELDAAALPVLQEFDFLSQAVGHCLKNSDQESSGLLLASWVGEVGEEGGRVESRDSQQQQS